MSRSYREPWVKDPSARYMKPIHARRFRRVCRMVMKKYLHDPFDFEYLNPDPVFPDPRLVTHPYDICDYRFPWSDPKARRK